jgi:hypothetical protein
MGSQKKAFTTLALFVLVVIGVAASKPHEEKFKNLKVLPKNITGETLKNVMEEFNSALGVDCNFCHSRSQTDTAHLDFESDQKPEKSIARKMIKMSNKINKQFFEANSKYGEENAMLEVKCFTCHHGETHPEEKKEEKKELKKEEPRQ